MAILVIGPSSVGKSTYINTLSEQDSNASMIIGLQVKKSEMPADSYVHYNLLHRYRSPRAACHNPLMMRGEYISTGPDALLDEKILSSIIASQKISEARVLVAPIKELEARMQAREHVEINDNKSYCAELWLGILAAADLFRLYELLFELLEAQRIPYQVIFCTGQGTDTDGQQQFIPSDRVFVHKHLNGQPCTMPAKESVQAVADSPFVEYQSVELPYGISTPSNYGHLNNRENFLSLLPDGLAGKSVLDIGCAMGGLVIAAERLGAKGNVGVELNRKRYNGANFIGKLLDTENTYYNTDFMALPLTEAFDYVFCLNVIHHIEDYSSFLRKACSLTKQAFIIEYPTLADQKFKTCHTLPEKLVELLNEQPLIGVSSLKVDQTYTFTEKAMDALLFDKIGGFRGKINRVSRIKHRILSVYYK